MADEDFNRARAFGLLANRSPLAHPLVFVAYGEPMERDARQVFAGTGVRVIRAGPLGAVTLAEIPE